MPEKPKKQETPREAIHRKITETFKPEVKLVADAIKQSDKQSGLCIVTGPFGNGKSTTLLPEVRMALFRRGIVSNIFDFYDHATEKPEVYLESMFPPLSDGEKRTVIIDEASFISMQGEEACIQVLETAYARGYSVVPVIAYNANRPDARDKEIETWKNAEKIVSGKDAKTKVINLPPKRITKELAREYLEAHISENNPMTPKAIEWIIENVPLNLRILYMYAFESIGVTSREVARSAFSALGNASGALTREEYAQMQEKGANTAFADVPTTIRRAIAFDWDNTVARTHQVLKDVRGIELSDKPDVVRYGMEDLLKELSESGFVSFVTTSGGTGYVGEAVRRTGLTEYFRRIFGYNEVSFGVGKNYLAVADEMDYTPDQAKAQMIVVGDSPGDQPIDIDKLVFMQVPHLHIDALVIREIITHLLEKGNGDFSEGFSAVYETAAVIREYDDFQQRLYDVGNGIQIVLEYREFKKGRFHTITTPTIAHIIAPEYQKEPALLSRE